MNGNKVWTEEEIKAHLKSGHASWLVRALMALWKRQTPSEQHTFTTQEFNQRGFNGFDAKILTAFAEQWRARGSLSPKQLNVLQRRLPKYSRQLTEIANEEGRTK